MFEITSSFFQTRSKCQAFINQSAILSRKLLYQKKLVVQKSPKETIQYIEERLAVLEKKQRMISTSIWEYPNMETSGGI